MNFITIEPTEKELIYLNSFLTANHNDAKPLNLTQAHGFLCAIASAPCLIMHSKYQPILLGGYPEFESMEQARKIFTILDSLYNNINKTLKEGKSIDNILTPYDSAPLELIKEWCSGYIKAVDLDPTWCSDNIAVAMLDPLYVLSVDSKTLVEEPYKIENISAHKLILKQNLPKTIKEIFEYWSEARKNPKCIRGDGPPPEMTEQKRLTEALPKIGRNEPCFCGSGEKFKKCCGSSSRTLH